MPGRRIDPPGRLIGHVDGAESYAAPLSARPSFAVGAQSDETSPPPNAGRRRHARIRLLAGPWPVRAASAPSAATAAPGGGVLRAVLDNGLRVVIVRDTLAPVVTTQVTYLAGGYQTPKGFPGTAHALEHMMFRGSKGLTGAQLNEITGKMGGESNAFTTNDATQYTFVAPATYLDVLLRIEAGRMRGALLTDADWKLERGAIEQEVSRDISDPGFLAFERAEDILYAGTGYAKDPLGTRPSFDKTTSKMLRAFYDDWYQPGNAILVIVGDVDPSATLDNVKALFGSMPSRPTPARKPVTLKPFKAQTIARTTPDATGTVQFLYRMPGMISNDDAAAQVLVDVLNNPRSGLSELAAQGTVLSADAQIQPFSHGGIASVEVGFAKGGDAQQARAHLDRTIEALLKDGVSPDLVEAAKRSELAQFEFNKNSAVSLASAWSRALAWQGLDSPEAAEQRIQAVTADDVNRIAREYLRPQARVTIVLTPDANGKRPPDSSGFGGTESFAGNDKLDVPLPDWAAQALARLEMPHWTLDPTQLKLANGITLIVQPETVSKTVTVVGHVDHDAGLQEPAGQEGVGRLLASLFDYGTATLDRTAFHKALDAIAASESGGEDFSLSVPSADFDRGLQLLADNVLHPALPQQAFAVQQQTLARTLAGELQTPEYKMLRALRQGLLPAGDPQPARSDARDGRQARSGRCQALLRRRLPSRPDHDRSGRRRHAGSGKGGDREVLRPMEGAGPETQCDSTQGAAQSAELRGRAESLRIPGSGADGPDAGARPVRCESLCAAARQRRARRQRLRFAADGGHSRQARLRLRCRVPPAVRPLAFDLLCRVRKRPGQGGAGRCAGAGQHQGHAADGRERRRAR